MRVIREEQRWSLPRAVLFGIVYALIVLVAMRIGSAAAPVPVNSTAPVTVQWNEYARMAFVFLVTVVPHLVFLARRLNYPYMFFYCVMFSLIITLLNTVEWEVSRVRGKPFVPVLYHNGLTTLILDAFTVFCFSLAVTIVVTLIMLISDRVRYGPTVVQDGTRCPQCGYCVLAAQNRICSECGREFTYQELGISPEEFDRRKSDICAD